MKRILGLIAIFALVLALAACGNPQPQQEEKLYIGILQLAEHPALDHAREGFLQALADHGYTEENVVFDLQVAQNDKSNLLTMSERFINNDADLILAIATPAAQTVAGLTHDIPIVVTAVTDPADARIVASNEAPGRNVTGTSDMNPIEDQLTLLLRLCPDIARVGILYDSGEDNSILQADIARQVLENLGLEAAPQTVTGTNDVQQAVQSMAGQVDAIFLPTDNTLATAMPIILEVTDSAGIPVICGEESMVEAGGLATMGINYVELGYQTGEMAVRILQGADPAAMPIETQQNFAIRINGVAAQKLGIEIPEDLEDFVF